MIIMNIIVLIIFKIKNYICSKSNSGKIIKKFDYLIQLLALRPKQAGMGLGCAHGYQRYSVSGWAWSFKPLSSLELKLSSVDQEPAHLTQHWEWI